ncbi:hypothetical protein [Rhizobium sp. P32RR-XVIII]|uniref:hypothetical protein n=1 Tax=Rhizobium sp. P32RR-XVIII TaxID=2726738 RepID=UPI00197F20B6|nr:hypothetical protein [Rhizobium sp. P32RR-XVIII]
MEIDPVDGDTADTRRQGSREVGDVMDDHHDTHDAEGPAGYYHSKKDRVFVRAIEGAYNLTEELNRLRAMPRVRKARDIKFVDGPQAYSRHYVEPEHGITQTFHLHLEEYGPGGKSQKHGHVNEAAFYILDGDGYEVHDNIRYDWTAGASRSYTTTACTSISTPLTPSRRGLSLSRPSRCTCS